MTRMRAIDLAKTEPTGYIQFNWAAELYKRDDKAPSYDGRKVRYTHVSFRWDDFLNKQVVGFVLKNGKKYYISGESLVKVYE